MNNNGFLLLTSQLGNPERKPLTTAQFRVLAQRVQQHTQSAESGELTVKHLQAMGFDGKIGAHICGLLEDTALLEHYLRRGREKQCFPITRQDIRYPMLLRRRLGLDAPGCLWYKGNLELLSKPKISLVGSRDLHPANRSFAYEVGRQAALQGYALVSGNARGADSVAQQGCLDAGGFVISVVADALENCAPSDRMLYLSEEDYDVGFSSFRALRRNRVIHTLGELTLVAQCSLGKGGTWNGTVQNLKNPWSPVVCLRDGSDAVRELEQMGANLIDISYLEDFASLAESEHTFFDDL